MYVAEHAATSPPAKSKSPAPIVVMPGPHGLIIASDDTEALDEFEHLLDLLAGSGGNGRKVSVFYLKYAKATDVTETLGQIMAGSTTTSPASSQSDGGGGNPMMAMFGGQFGGFGGRFGGGGRRGRNNAAAPSNTEGATTATIPTPAGRTGLATGPIKITADQRLNALLVRANRADLDTIEELLKVLDQKDSPEDISVATKPRLIAVENYAAQEIADIVKQVYADRLVDNPSANPRGRFFAMMASRMGGQSNQSGADVPKMSISVDTRTNSLIVAAPDALFEEVKQLVAQLDTAAGDQNQTMRVVTLHRTSSSAIEEALAAIAGDSVQMSRTGGLPATLDHEGTLPVLRQPAAIRQLLPPRPVWTEAIWATTVRATAIGQRQNGQRQYGQRQKDRGDMDRANPVGGLSNHEGQTAPTTGPSREVVVGGEGVPANSRRKGGDRPAPARTAVGYASA